MTSNRDRFLEELCAGTARVADHDVVETLRAAAGLLDGTDTTMFAPGTDELSRLRIAIRLAAALRDMGQRLCDHARVRPDGRCRYCEALVGVVEGGS